jgi:GTPase Era involved in 16S rRNA processing
MKEEENKKILLLPCASALPVPWDFPELKDEIQSRFEKEYLEWCNNNLDENSLEYLEWKEMLKKEKIIEKFKEEKIITFKEGEPTDKTERLIVKELLEEGLIKYVDDFFRHSCHYITFEWVGG